ncbi:SDR family oxidoreductase [Candidatus Microgenomates bacterium]|nr:MAG: SDR family oxidoreductase [Candidatus Microgenomates bacterium]
MKILGTGLSGLVGSRVVELLKEQYEFQNLSYETGIDITNKESIEKAINNSSAQTIIHFAAKTNVDGCEKDKEKDLNILMIKDPKEQEKEFLKEKTAYAINVLGTKNIAEACNQNGKNLIYISTDFVFDGEKDEEYTEEDVPNPVNWYAQTKYEGEKIVKNSGIPWAIVRISYPYRSFFERKDFVRAVIGKMEKGEKLNMVTDHIMSPSFIDDIAKALDVIIKSKQTGILHVVGSQFVSPYEAGIIIANIFNFDQSLVLKTSREEYFKGRALRPLYLKLKNDKIEKLGIRMSTLEEGLREVKRQIDSF